MKRKSWGLGGVEVFGRLEGLLPRCRCRHCVEWVKGSNPPPLPPRPREVSQTLVVPNVLPHERRKKKKKEEEGACKEREAASGKIFCDGSSGEWGGGVFVRHVASFVSRCLETGPLAEESPIVAVTSR